MFTSFNPPGIDDFLSEQKKKRDQRQNERKQLSAVQIIQRFWRGHSCRKRITHAFRDKVVQTVSGTSGCSSEREYLQILRFLKFRFNKKNDMELFISTCKFLFKSIISGTENVGYDSCLLLKDTAADWIILTKWLLSQSVFFISTLSTTTSSDAKSLNILLSFLIILTDSSRWSSISDPKLAPGMKKLVDSLINFLVDNNLYPSLHVKSILQAKASCSLTEISLTALFTISIRPLISRDFDAERIRNYAIYILSVPGFVLHMNSILPQTYEKIIEQRLCSKLILFLYKNPLVTLEGSSVLYLIANLIQLSLLEMEVLADQCVEYCVVLSKLLNQLTGYVGQKQSNQSSWHPILGWFAQPTDKNLSSVLPHVMIQLKLLWHQRMVKLLFSDLYEQALLNHSSSNEPCSSSAIKTSIVNDSLPSVVVQQPSFTRHNRVTTNLKKKFGLSIFLNQINDIGRKCGVINSQNGSLESSSPISHKNRPGPKDLPDALKAVCLLYCSTFSCLREIRNDILSGLSLGDLLPRMWRLIYKCGSVGDWAKVVVANDSTNQSVTTGFRCNIIIPSPHSPNEAHLLYLFCAATSNLLIILDDMEIFELHKSFSTQEMCEMGRFFNTIFYNSVILIPDPSQLSMWTNSANKFSELLSPTASKKIAPSSISKSSTQSSSQSANFSIPIHLTLLPVCHKILEILYERDNRFNYAPLDFWLIKDVRPAAFLTDVRKMKPHARFLLKYVPHIIPHRERVTLFRDYVRADKISLGRRGVSNYFVDESPIGANITVHRNRIVEDGYQQLANLSPNQLKLKIRVIFSNQMGLDEVGIDLDGVFKEFLEETLRHVFDPGLNLFRVTTDHRLYPSPTSYLQDIHLQLFEFLGKMLAKAIYEGIVVDVPFATFFLTQLLGREKTGCYSFLDELATLDRDLYKGLTQIKVVDFLFISQFLFKHYEGDVADLSLTFSYDEEKLGEVVVHDLCPGGRYIPVTNDLRISYVHRVAHFRMYKQIRAQTISFIRGFYSLLNPGWLNMFSASELQKLISGDSSNIDIDDLKNNTKYTGGFHAKHRVVLWLWDVLKKDFDEKERGLFLKFVTSCSKPPLLGFCHLEPQFCIRCVQYTSEDQDLGDSFGSVVKAFFNLNSHQPREEAARLPTASTCFNLLKLPNYSSRSLLKEKLRYAIHSNAGFELS